MTGLLLTCGSTVGAAVAVYGFCRHMGDGRGVLISGFGAALAVPCALVAARNIGWL